MSWILRALPGVGGKTRAAAAAAPLSHPHPRPYGLVISLFVLPRPSISCYFIVLRLNSGSHRLYRFRVTYARVSSTCKETHIRAYEARTRYTRTIYTPIQIYESLVGGWEYVCRYTEYLALSIQRKGITYYRRLPARRTLIYCYPVRISCGKKRMPANSRPTLQRRSLRGFHPLPLVDRCFTSGRLSFALITFPSAVRFTSFTIFIIYATYKIWMQVFK